MGHLNRFLNSDEMAIMRVKKYALECCLAFEGVAHFQLMKAVFRIDDKPNETSRSSFN